jgi:mono/diheme cytochrome c family protein
VLAIWIFLGFWVVLGLSLFFVAMRGGLGGVRAAVQSRSRRGHLGLGLFSAFIYLGFGLAFPLALLTGNHSNASAQVGGLKLTRAEKQGRVLFGEHCGVCHTLAAANAVGKVGPNLDQLQPPAELVLRTIVNGCFQNASTTSNTSAQVCLGQGTMPAGIVQGRDATKVAQFVARVAGKE